MALEKNTTEKEKDVSLRIEIGANSVDYAINLAWQPVGPDSNAQDDIAHRIGETGMAYGVVMNNGKTVGFGLCGKPAAPLPSAAALLALLNPESAVCAIEWFGDRNDGMFWMAAVDNGIVISGTDVVLPSAEVKVQADSLTYEFECQLTGSGSAEFGGDGISTFGNPAKKISQGMRKQAAVRRQKRFETGKIAVLSLLVIAVGTMAWFLFREPAPGPASSIDTAAQASAKRQRAAIDMRNAMLSTDLSGYGIAAFAELSEKGEADRMKGFERSARFWRLTNKRCLSAGQCSLSWQAENEYADIGQLARALGVAREELSHDMKGDMAMLPKFTLPGGDKVVAREDTDLNGKLFSLIDACRRLTAETSGFASCTVSDPQIISLADAQALPKNLFYRKGKVVIELPFGHIAKLYALFGQNWLPWLRAEKTDFDYGNQKIKLEAHYVIK